MNPIKALAFGRIAAGAGSFLSPSLTGQLFGLGGPPESHLAARLFGGRDLALGIGTLLFEGEQRRGVIRVGVAADVLDVAASVLGLREKTTTTRYGVPLIALATGAIVIGVGELKAS